MAFKFVHSLRSMRIGSRINLMTGSNALVAVLLLSLAWLAMDSMEARLAEMERLREQSTRMETIAKRGLRLLLLARQLLEQGSAQTISQLHIYGANIEQLVLREAREDPSISEQIGKLRRDLKQFQNGFDEVYSLKQNLADEYENLLELGENIANFLAIVNANARGEQAYDLLPELEKANRWLHQSIAGVNRFYFSGDQFSQAENGLVTLSIYLPAVADRAGNSLRSRYLYQAGELVEDYLQGLQNLQQGKARESVLAKNEINEPQAEIQETINEILRHNSQKVHAGAQAMRRELERTTILGLSLAAGLLLLSGLLSWAIGRSITSPLNALHQAVRDQAEGRPVRHIPTGEGDDEVAAMSGTLRKVISLQAEKDALIHELQAAKSQVSQALERIRNLLDNSGQGVVSFGPDLLVDQEFSRECLNLFQREDIAGAPVHELLCPHDAQARENLATNLRRICTQKDPHRRDLLLSLMPSEFAFNEKTVEVQYRLLPPSRGDATDQQGDQRLMLLLTDVSQARELEQAVHMETRRLALVVAAVKNRNELLDVMDDFQNFLAEITAAAGNGAPESPERVMRLLHTYKGLFSLVECIHLPPALHEAESRVAALAPGADADALLAAVDPPALEQAAQQDLEVIRATLGPSFLQSRGEVLLPADKAAELLQLAEELALHLPPAAPETIARGLATLRRLRHRDLRSMLERYPAMALQLAERQDKELEPFAVTGDEVLVDPQRWAPFVRSLVHVLRNAVDHGLESREERQASGKPPAGSMRCHVRSLAEGGVQVTVSDDGRGLDLEALQARAAEIGVETPENPFALVFAQGLSTTTVSDVGSSPGTAALSGRGVGMAAVKAEVERLGGDISINSEKGRGTQFEFFIPDEPA